MTEDIIKILNEIDLPRGRERLRIYLEQQPYPHFKAHPEHRNLLIRTEADGTQTIGQFINRKWTRSSIG